MISGPHVRHRPLKSAHLISPSGFGGAETVVRALAAGRSAGVRETPVIAMVEADTANQFIQPLEEAGVPVFPLARLGRRYLAEALAVRHLATDLGLDVLNTHTAHSDMIGYLAARMGNFAVVGTVHGFVAGDSRTRFYEWFDRLLLKRFDGVICVSKCNQKRMLASGCPRDRVYVVPNGVPQSEFLSREESRERLRIPATDRVVGWIGRLSHEKGPDLFLDALQDVHAQSAMAVLIGDGPMRESLEQRASARSFPTRFVGAIPDAASLVSAFDLLVMSSRTEGLPMVLLEAFTAAVPVAAFAVGGIPEVLSNRTGWLVDPLDTSALGRAIGEALADGPSCDERGSHGRQLVLEKYGQDSWVSQTEEVYNQAVDRRRRSG